jgi:hypothetical protein
MKSISEKSTVHITGSLPTENCLQICLDQDKINGILGELDTGTTIDHSIRKL